MANKKWWPKGRRAAGGATGGEKVIFMARGSRVTPSAWATAACPCQSADCPAHATSSPPTLPAPCQLCALPRAPGGHLSLSLPRTGYLWQKCKINDVWREIVAKKMCQIKFWTHRTLSLPWRDARGDTPRQRRPGRRSEALNFTTATEKFNKIFQDELIELYSTKQRRKRKNKFAKNLKKKIVYQLIWHYFLGLCYFFLKSIINVTTTNL